MSSGFWESIDLTTQLVFVFSVVIGILEYKLIVWTVNYFMNDKPIIVKSNDIHSWKTQMNLQSPSDLVRKETIPKLEDYSDIKLNNL